MFISRAKEKGKELVNGYLSLDGVEETLNDLKEGRYKIAFHYDENKEFLVYEAFFSDYSLPLPEETYIKLSVSSNGLPIESLFSSVSNKEMALYAYLYEIESKLDKDDLLKIYGKDFLTLNEVPSFDEKESIERNKLREEFLNILNEKGNDELPINKPNKGKWDLIVRIRERDGGFLLSLELWDGNENKLPIASLSEFFDSFMFSKPFEYHDKLYSLERSLFTDKGDKTINYLRAISRMNPSSFKNEMPLSPDDFGDVIEICLGENIYFNGEQYYVMKDVSKAGFSLKKNNIELIPQINIDAHCRSILLKNGLIYIDTFSSVISLFRFANPTSRKIFAFFLEHDIKDPSLVSDIFRKKVNSSSLKEEDEGQRFSIALYVDISEEGSLSFRSEYLLCGRSIPKEEAALNVSFRDDINLYLVALKEVGGIENGIQENQRDALKFLQSDLSLLKKRAKIYLSKKLSKSKVTHIGKINLHIERHEDWLSLKAKSKSFSSEQLSLILEAYHKKKTFVLLGEEVVILDDPSVKELSEIKQKEKLDDSFSKNRLPIFEAFRLNEEYSSNEVKIDLDRYLKEAFQTIKNFKDKEVELKENISKVLRPYQRNAISWLTCLYEYKLGGILADDMGLGKTLETIAFLSSLKANKPSLVIAPKSVIYNWEKEFNNWDKDAKIIVIDGGKDKRVELLSGIKNDEKATYITSYDSLRNDISLYKAHSFDVLITDEAQLIKNYSALKSKAVRNIKSSSRFALTGTPIENSMADLWSIFDFLMPNYLNTYGIFKTRYVLAGNQEEARKSLRKKITPFLLRRTKKEVLKELPQKEVEVLTLTMDDESKLLYESTLDKAKKELEHAKDKTSPNHDRFSSFNFLPVLTTLREICVDPSSFFEGVKTKSAKLSYVLEYASKSISNGHKLLIFSSFTKVLDTLGDLFKENGIASYYIHGGVSAKNRLDLSNKFNKENDVSVMLVSLKAGGTGLNLAGADVVIHLDPWWNLASEEQATDRAYRIGQKRPVTVLKLICHQSIEEKVLLLQKYKKDLYEDVIQSGESVISSLSEEDIAFLLS